MFRRGKGYKNTSRFGLAEYGWSGHGWAMFGKATQGAFSHEQEENANPSESAGQTQGQGVWLPSIRNSKSIEAGLFCKIGEMPVIRYVNSSISPCRA